MANKNQIIKKGKGAIIFESLVKDAELMSPLEGFNRNTQKIEFRKDPLTGHKSRINKLRAERVKQASSPGENFEHNLQELINLSSKKCYFCPENITKSTPKFIEELGIGERLIGKNVALFPNLFVFSQYHVVGTLGENHFTQLDEISADIWEEAIIKSIQYFSAVYKMNKNVRYPSINFNFLPPSASSIIHPHIQIIQDEIATGLTEIYLQKSKEYYELYCKNSKSNYWLDLIGSEREIKDRFISENELLAWIASFSPMGKNEITGIVKLPKTDITKFSPEEIRLLAEELVKALKALYNGRGARSVNMAMFLGPIDDDCSNFYRINIKIVTRPTLTPNYTGDIGFMELLHQETIADASPEIVAESIRNYF
ncbi:MAG: hypothetical protein FK734_20715 [Asgard group archaeon]|nr:hypothetical protein [Asgard group archaeon]